jgi:hypothetical protein
MYALLWLLEDQPIPAAKVRIWIADSIALTSSFGANGFLRNIPALPFSGLKTFVQPFDSTSSLRQSQFGSRC